MGSEDFYIDLNAVVYNAINTTLINYGYSLDEILQEYPKEYPIDIFDKITGSCGDISLDADEIRACISYINFLISSYEKSTLNNFKNMLYNNIKNILDESREKNQCDEIMIKYKIIDLLSISMKNYDYNYREINNNEFGTILKAYIDVILINHNYENPIKIFVEYIVYIIDTKYRFNILNFDNLNKELYENIFNSKEELEKEYGKGIWKKL